MQCADVTERLLADEVGSDPTLDDHVAGCSRCEHVARGLNRLGSVLGSTLVVEPPVELQRRLSQLVLEAPGLQTAPWWRRAFGALAGEWNLAGWLAARPQTIAVQGLAGLMLSLASWQIFGWWSTFRPVVGDIGYAVELLVSSPAVAYLGGFQLDLQSLGLWSLVGIGGWLISENGLLGRRLSSTRLRLP